MRNARSRDRTHTDRRLEKSIVGTTLRGRHALTRRHSIWRVQKGCPDGGVLHRSPGGRNACCKPGFGIAGDEGEELAVETVTQSDSPSGEGEGPMRARVPMTAIVRGRAHLVLGDGKSLACRGVCTRRARKLRDIAQGLRPDDTGDRPHAAEGLQKTRADLTQTVEPGIRSREAEKAGTDGLHGAGLEPGSFATCQPRHLEVLCPIPGSRQAAAISSSYDARPRAPPRALSMQLRSRGVPGGRASGVDGCKVWIPSGAHVATAPRPDRHRRQTGK